MREIKCFIRQDGWKLVIIYIRRLEAVGLFLRNRKTKDYTERWIDMDDLKAFFLAQSRTGEFQFLQDTKKQISE